MLKKPHDCNGRIRKHKDDESCMDEGARRRNKSEAFFVHSFPSNFASSARLLHQEHSEAQLGSLALQRIRRQVPA